jgi:hypothetical protein
MKKLFLRRHILFFITLAILVVCQAMILRHCFNLYGKNITQREHVAALMGTLGVKRENLPDDHMEAERRMRSDMATYKKFVLETWPRMAKLSQIGDQRLCPPNHIAVFFEIADYINWAKESCDSLGIEFEPSCTFGFSGIFEKNEQPLSTEIHSIHRQKEQLKLLLSYLFESKSSYLKVVEVARGDASMSTYFRNADVFPPEVRRVDGNDSYVYRIKFTAFTDTFRNFLKNLHENEIPVILRQLSVQPNYTLRLNNGNRSRLLECLPSTFTLTVEFLNIPQSFSHHGKRSAAVARKILYETGP